MPTPTRVTPAVFPGALRHARHAATDAHARRWFWRYWTLGVGSGAHILVQGLLDVTREMAEGPPDTPA